MSVKDIMKNIDEESSRGALVSVIIPAYNSEKFIARAVKSIQGQYHKHFELIVVDDGSTDETAGVVKQLAKTDDRIKLISKGNGGVSSARNVGLDKAKGDYVCFLDSDDYVEPDYISYLLELILEHSTDAAVTTGLFWSHRGDKQVVEEKISIMSPEQATAEILYYRLPIGCYSKLFRSDVLKSNKIRFLENLRVGEGFNFNTTVFQHALSVISSNRRLYHYYRENDKSAMTVFHPDKSENGLLAIQTIRKNLLRPTRKLIKAVKFAEYHTNMDFCLWISGSRSDDKYPDLYKKYKTTSRKMALGALFSGANVREKMWALVMLISPRIRIRIWKYKRGIL